MEMIPFDERVDGDSLILRINISFSCYHKGNFAGLEIIINWSIGSNNCIAGVRGIIRTILSFNITIEIAFGYTVNIYVRQWKIGCYFNH